MKRFSFFVCLLLTLAGGAWASESEEWEHFYRSQVYPLALNVYHEGRGESDLGRLMVAYVTVKRAEENRSEWGGGTVKGVVFKGCQFSWTCDSKTKPPTGRAWERAVEAATLVALGLFRPPPELEGARYYMNPDAAGKRGKCWLATNLRQVGIVGNHYFYAEGKPWLIPQTFGCD